MHLIMKALEKVTSCAHPNVSETSLLITALSGFLHLNSKKRKKEKKKHSSLFRCLSHLSLIQDGQLHDHIIQSQYSPCTLGRGSLRHKKPDHLRGE